ncbi:MAG: amidase family protein [Pseudomonadota bacterium]
MHSVIRESARSVVAMLARGEATPAELLDLLEARVAAVDPGVNALPTLCFDRARTRAEALIARPPAERGVLQGLPVPIKDLAAVAGVRTTMGSPIYADHVPESSDHVVARIEAEGGLVYAKSNTPEFGAGASTFNEVFGRTGNPWNTARSAAGSSGGAAAALAAGMAWLAHGSDMGGSLRNPASFCGVVGLRPTPGRVPRGPRADPFGTLSTEGPMARSIGDLGLFLDAMAGGHPAEPFAPEAESFRAAAEAPRLPRRVAFSPDLGITPVEPEVAEICAAAARQFERLGATVEEAHPDFTGAHEAFQTLRALAFVVGHEAHLRDHRALMKPDLIWNTEKGLALRGPEIAEAMRLRGQITANFTAFMADYDLLLTPATAVAPFPVGARTVEEIAGQRLDTYIDWVAIAYAITLTSAPALSLPCGFTADGLPVGLQMVGRLRGEGPLLSFAAALEDALGVDTGPIDPRILSSTG